MCFVLLALFQSFGPVAEERSSVSVSAFDDDDNNNLERRIDRWRPICETTRQMAVEMRRAVLLVQTCLQRLLSNEL